MRLLVFPSLLLLLLVAAPLHVAGYSISDSKETPEDLSLLKVDAEDPADKDTSTSDSTPNTTESTKETDSTETETPEETTTTIPVTTTTIPVTTTTTPVTTTTANPNVTLPPINELQLYETTRDELNDMEDTLDQFLVLVPDLPTNEASKGTKQNHPGAWWKLEKKRDDTGSFCITEGLPPRSTNVCQDLEENLQEIQMVVEPLNNDEKTWGTEDLKDLMIENRKLSQIYKEADADEGFKESVDAEKFAAVVGEVKQEVQDGLDVANSKISDLTANPGSVVLVAVIGTFGGLMVVGLVGVMIYGVINKKKLKKKSTAPYNKLHGESIPIDGFLADGPESRQVPRTDPYARNPTPASRSDPYASPYGPSRNESNYRGPTITRVGQGLPRTHL